MGTTTRDATPTDGTAPVAVDGVGPEVASPSGDPATVGDLLAVPSLAGATVVPADADLGAPVAAVGVLDPEAPSEAGAIVLAPGNPPTAAPDGCVAVVARTAPATPLGVPCIVLARGIPWGVVNADLVGALSADGGLRRAADARRAFGVPLLGGHGFAGLATVAGELLGHPVVILDEYLDRQGQAGLTESQERLLDEAVGRARGHGPASVLGPFCEEELQDQIRVPVSAAGEPVGVIVVWSPPPPDHVQVAVLDELAMACALERVREDARAETESRLRGELIEELLAGEAISRDSVVRRARHLGADLSGGSVALLGKLLDPYTEGRVITDQRLVRRFLQQAQAVIGLSWPLSLVEWDNGQLLCLLPPTTPELREAPRDVVEEAALTLARRLLGATRETVPGLALTLALSRFTPEPERLGAALEEARLALSIGERLGRTGEVITFEETGTYKLLFQIFADRPEELSTFYDQTLAPLVRYDDQYQTELVATLSTYLGHDCNLAATASTLFTHRHTVRYRLDRIAELSGLDISRTDDREKLSLGLKAMRLLGKRVASAGERRGRA